MDYGQGQTEHQKVQGLLPMCQRLPGQGAGASGELGEKGYEVVKADEEKCIGCGMCYRMCPDCVIEITD